MAESPFSIHKVMGDALDEHPDLTLTQGGWLGLWHEIVAVLPDEWLRVALHQLGPDPLVSHHRLRAFVFDAEFDPHFWDDGFTFSAPVDEEGHPDDQ